MKICFITDGGQQTGLGHVQQSKTVATGLRGRGAHITFLTKSDETVMRSLQSAGFETTRLHDDDEILRHLMRVDPDVIVFDKIDVDEQLARDIKNKSSARLVIFTNLTDANRYADVAITADIGSQFKNVSFTDDATHTLYYYGPKYWVLRPEFHEYKRRGKVASHSPTRLLLIFGGSDPANITTVVLDNLLGQNRVFHIAVVLGAHFGHNDAIGAILERHVRSGTTVTVHRNVSNVAELMYDADLVLASPGLSVFEALCVGTPVIVMPQDFLQRETYLGFMQMLDRDSVSELEGMIDTGRFTYPSDDHIVRMEIGEGVSELMDVIMHLEKR